MDKAQLAFCTNNLRKIKNTYKGTCHSLKPVVQRSVVDTALKKEMPEQVHDKNVNASSPALDLKIVKEQPVKHKEKSKPVSK